MIFGMQEWVSKKYLRLRFIISHEQFSILTINLSRKFFCEIDSSCISIGTYYFHGDNLALPLSHGQLTLKLLFSLRVLVCD